MFTVFRFFTPFFVAVYTRVQAKSQHFWLVQSGDFLLAIKEIRVRQSEVLKLEDGRHQAAKGLFLEVRGNGRHRSWLFIYRRHGKRSAIGLGSVQIRNSWGSYTPTRPRFYDRYIACNLTYRK